MGFCAGWSFWGRVDPVFLASAHATSPELAVMVRPHVQ